MDDSAIAVLESFLIHELFSVQVPSSPKGMAGPRVEAKFTHVDHPKAPYFCTP